MQNPRRAEEQENYTASEQEERRTHGFHQELDADRNGRPDYLEDEQKENAAREKWRQNDRNNNGIPDHLETDKPGGKAANDDFAPYGQEFHRNSTLDAETRHSAGVFAATSETAEPASDLQKSVSQASAAASQEIRKDESNPKKGEFGKSAIGKRVDQLRKKRLPKSSMLGDISRLPPQKGDPDSSTEVVKAFWKGIVQAHLSTKAAKKAKADAKIDQELRQLEKNERELDRAERERGQADAESKKTAKGEERPESPEQSGKADEPKKTDPLADAKETAKSGSEKKDGLSPEAKAQNLDERQKELKPEAAAQPEKATSSLAKETSPLQAPANDRMTKAQEGLRSMGLAPQGPQVSAKERTLDGPNAEAKPVSPMMEQVRGLKRPDVLVEAKGPTNPAPRTRAMGLGSGLSMFTKALRKESSQETSLEIQSAMQKSRDSGGMGR